jgi:hypothetical protein
VTPLLFLTVPSLYGASQPPIPFRFWGFWETQDLRTSSPLGGLEERIFFFISRARFGRRSIVRCFQTVLGFSDRKKVAKTRAVPFNHVFGHVFLAKYVHVFAPKQTTEFLGLTLLGEQHSGFTPLWEAASWP